VSESSFDCATCYALRGRLFHLYLYADVPPRQPRRRRASGTNQPATQKMEERRDDRWI
jgi:hypothetical protein